PGGRGLAVCLRRARGDVARAAQVRAQLDHACLQGRAHARRRAAECPSRNGQGQGPVSRCLHDAGSLSRHRHSADRAAATGIGDHAPGPGLNIMDLAEYTTELQALVIRSVLEWVYESAPPASSAAAALP